MRESGCVETYADEVGEVFKLLLLRHISFSQHWENILEVDYEVVRDPRRERRLTSPETEPRLTLYSFLDFSRKSSGRREILVETLKKHTS